MMPAAVVAVVAVVAVAAVVAVVEAPVIVVLSAATSQRALRRSDGTIHGWRTPTSR
jgi:hypothetical protein